MQDIRLPEHPSVLESIDLYGLRISWSTAPSEIYVFSPFHFMMGMIDCVVIFSVANLVAIKVALYLCGSKSAKWRAALMSPIGHLVVSRDEARKEHGRRLSKLSSNGASATAVTPARLAWQSDGVH